MGMRGINVRQSHSAGPRMIVAAGAARAVNVACVLTNAGPINTPSITTTSKHRLQCIFGVSDTMIKMTCQIQKHDHGEISLHICAG